MNMELHRSPRLRSTPWLRGGGGLRYGLDLSESLASLISLVRYDQIWDCPMTICILKSVIEIFLNANYYAKWKRNIGRQYKTTLPCLTQIQTSDKQSWKCAGKINEARLSAEMSESN
jgi:hypothetical protein